MKVCEYKLWHGTWRRIAVVIFAYVAISTVLAWIGLEWLPAVPRGVAPVDPDDVERFRVLRSVEYSLACGLWSFTKWGGVVAAGICIWWIVKRKYMKFCALRAFHCAGIVLEVFLVFSSASDVVFSDCCWVGCACAVVCWFIIGRLTMTAVYVFVLAAVNFRGTFGDAFRVAMKFVVFVMMLTCAFPVGRTVIYGSIIVCNSVILSPEGQLGWSSDVFTHTPYEEDFVNRGCTNRYMPGPFHPTGSMIRYIAKINAYIARKRGATVPDSYLWSEDERYEDWRKKVQ